MDDNRKYMKELADNMWSYFKPKIEEMVRNKISFYRAYVAVVASDNKMGVKRPFDETIVYLPYVSSLADATVGSQVTVVVLGENKNNSIVIGDGSLSNILTIL